MTKVICIDPGHGGSDGGAVAIDGRAEKHFTLALSAAVRDNLLSSYDCSVIMTRETDVYVDLGERAQIANRAKVDLFLSLHHDSAGNPLARGGSLYIHTNKRNPIDPTKLAWLPAISADGTVNHEAPKSYKLASAFVPIIRAELGRYNIPWRDQGDQAGVMCADFWVLDQSLGPAILLETHFGSNEHDNWAARQQWFIRDLAQAIAQGLATALELAPRAVAPSGPIATAVDGTPIIGQPLATVEQAIAWALKREGTRLFADLAPAYWRFGGEMGIRADVLYAQAAKETAFGRYSGQVSLEQNNMAGIKMANATGDRPEDHESFATPADGILAHFQHMGAYVGVAPLYPVHARYAVVKAQAWAGSIRTVEELGGKWAPNPDYGASIVRDYLNPMIATTAPVTPPAAMSELDKLTAAGLIDGHSGSETPVTWHELATVINRLMERGNL